MDKVYIGDGIYAEYLMEPGQVRLTTENGSTVMNEIYMEPREAQEIILFLLRIWPGLRGGIGA